MIFFNRNPRILWISLLSLLFAANQAEVVLPAEPLGVIRRPILNLPAIVQKSQSFEILCQAPQSSSNWSAKLFAPGVEYSLAVSGAEFNTSAHLWTLTAQVPADITPELFNLAVTASGGIADTAKHAVKVIETAKSSYTVVQITDSHLDRRANIDYNTLPEFLKITDEINLINPEFVLHTGDLAEEASQEHYYQVAQDALSRLQVPVFVTAGGHDLQIFQSQSENRQWWEKYFGNIMDFSFKYGNHFFAGLQEWEMPTQSFTDSQMQWLNAELSASKARGDGMRVLFYHYDVQGQLNSSLVNANNIELLLYGHVHINRDEIIGTSTHNISTAPTMDGGFGQFLYHGEYRLLHFENNQLAWTKVLRYNHLNIAYSPVNNGLNPEITASIENTNDLAFTNAQVRFWVPASFAPYAVTGGNIAFERDAGNGALLVVVQTDIPANSNKTLIIRPQAGLANHPPQITATSPERLFSLKAGQNQTFSVSATDADGDGLKYTWTLNGAVQGATGSSFAFTASNRYIGTNTLQVQVSDNQFADIYTWQITVVEQDLPYAIIAHPVGMLPPGVEATITWDEIISLDCYFRFGTSPGNYTLGSVKESGNGQKVSFIPQNVGLSSPGIYYGIITNSPDANISSSEYKSSEFQIIIEAQSTPDVLGPKGTVTDPSPVFQWQPVDGVPYYHIIVSDNPVQITEDANGETIVQGANIIWQAITPNTSIRYGGVDPSGYFNITNGTTPPLMTGLTYNYMVLNNYGNHPAFTSEVQGSVNEFVVDIPTNLTPPHLVSPADSAFITGNTITFQWDAVANAINYKISIFEERTESGSTVSFPIWETVTSNTLVDFPAGSYLINSNYIWKVLAWDNAGGGVQSINHHFAYATSVGTMQIRTKTSSGNNLPRVEVTITPVSGSADIIPLLTDDSGFANKVTRDGVYDLTARKDGYEQTTLRITLPQDPFPDAPEGDYPVNIVLQESPGNITGRVFNHVTEAGISNATVIVTETTTGLQKSTMSDADGNFLIGVSSGSWDIFAKKTGYIQSAIKTITVGPGANINLGNKGLGLTLNSGTLKGVVRSSTGKALLGAAVHAYTSNDTVTTITAANGAYQFTLTSKTWTIVAKKAGYVSSQPKNAWVPASGVATQDFSLVPHANLISGYVSDGSRSLSGATVTATPNAGSPVSTTSNNLGQYSLSLGTGTFTLSAQKSGYSAERLVQVSVTVGETVSGVNFTLVPNPSSISGRVTTDGTNGVAQAIVTNGSVSVTTTSSGNFTLSLPAGTHSVYAARQGYATSSTQTLSLTPGQTLTGLDFRMTPNAATISGKVTGNGLPIYQAQVEATSTSGVFQTQTDAQGNYSISLQPGDYSLLARKTGYVEPAPLSVMTNPGQVAANFDFDLVLNQATLTGTVRSTAGELLRNATITAIDLDNINHKNSTTSNVSGEYTLKITGEKKYKIRVSKDGFAPQEKTLGLLEAGSHQVQSFHLTPLPSSVSGTVRDTNGNPVPDVLILVGQDSVITNHLGDYTIYLQAGNYTLTTRKLGYEPASLSVSPGPGQNLTGIDLQLKDNFALLQGTITSKKAPLEGAVVSLSGVAKSATAISNLQGKFLLENLIPGIYSLTITLTGYEKLDTTLTLLKNANMDLSLQMTRLTGTLSGNVTADGQPIAGATVKAVSPEGSFMAITNQQGHYALSGLPKAAYQVSALRNGFTSPPAKDHLVPDSSGINFSLIPNKARLAGVVKQGNTLMENVKISATGAKGNTGFATTGVNGNFTIENLAADTYQIEAQRNGYMMQESELSVQLAPGSVDSLIINMKPISLSIAGKVLADGKGQPQIPVELRGGTITRTAVTNAQGNFSFGGLQPNSQYGISTNIFKPGFTETDTSVQVGLKNISNVNLYITISAGEISGSVGVGSVSITAQHSDGRTFSALSGSDGAYQIANLPAGTYTVAATRPGYSTEPGQRQVTISSTGKAEANFTLTANTGQIAGKISQINGKGLAGVRITAATDSLAPYSTISVQDGTFELTGLPGGRTYTVFAELSGFEANPPQQMITVQQNQTATANFTLAKNNGVIQGKVLVQSGGAIAQALVSLQNQSTAQGQSLMTDKEGQYSFGALPAGTYTLSVTKGGYQSVHGDSTVTLADGQTLSINLTMQSQTGELSGFIRYRGHGVDQVKVTAAGPTEISVATDQKGNFKLAALPAGIYDLQTQKNGFPPIVLPGIEVAKGSSQLLPLDFPGGRIEWVFTDGQNPISGVKVEVTPPQSQSVVITEAGREIFRGEIRDASNLTFSYMSDNAGRVATDSLRLAGTYHVTLSKKGFLLPKGKYLNVDLGLDEFKTVTIPLIFSHSPVGSANAKDSVQILLKYAAGLPQNRVIQPQLWVKRIGSDGFSAKPMQAVQNGFVAWIAPHTQSGIVQYYITATYLHQSEPWEYVSETHRIFLNSKGILYRVQISPGGGVLQKGARTRLSVRPVDDTGANLANAVTERGEINWQVLSGDSTAKLVVDANDPFRAYLWPKIDGTIRLKAVAKLDGLTKIGQANFTSKTMELANIDIQAPTQASNDNPIQLSFIATSSDSQSMRLDSEWRVEPSYAGTVNGNGLFTPAGDFFGDVKLSLVDLTSGKAKTVTINLFANIDSTTQQTFVDGTGLRLQFKKNSVIRRRQISLTKPSLPEVKKFTQDFQVVGGVYQLLPAGVTFTKSPNLMLPRSSTSLTGQPTLGWWEQTRLQWQPLQSTVTDSTVSAFIETLAQFAVLVGNEPLGIHGLSFLPSPFSPQRGVMRIGYVLSSEEGKALVTIRIYNMAGELVRTLMDRDVQYPGAHTELSLAWDGLTDTGLMARNGRYLVEVIAENVQGKARKLESVVLIK